MIPTNPLRAIVIAVAVLLVCSLALGVGGAHEGDRADGATKEVRIVDEEIVIADGLLTISDTTIEGPGLGDQHIEDSEYTVDSTLRFDGFHLTHNGTHYTVCRITVHIEDIGVRLQNVHLTDGRA